MHWKRTITIDLGLTSRLGFSLGGYKIFHVYKEWVECFQTGESFQHTHTQADKVSQLIGMSHKTLSNGHLNAQDETDDKEVLLMQI